MLLGTQKFGPLGHYQSNTEDNKVLSIRALRYWPFSIPGTWAERIWVGYENFLTIFDEARKIFATILRGAK